MNKLIKNFLFIVLFSTNLNADILSAIKKCEEEKKECAYKCIQKYSCSGRCPCHYVITPCIEEECDCCSLEKMEECLEQCGQDRSDCFNEAIESFCLDPWTPCPSCSMDF